MDETKNSLAFDSATLSLAARVVALRHFGLPCSGQIYFNGSETPAGWGAKLDIGADAVSEAYLRVSKLTGLYALDRYDLKHAPSGGNLRNCSPFDAGLTTDDLEHPTIEDEVTEALHIVDDQWPAIIAEWQKVKEDALSRR